MCPPTPPHSCFLSDSNRLCIWSLQLWFIFGWAHLVPSSSPVTIFPNLRHPSTPLPTPPLFLLRLQPVLCFESSWLFIQKEVEIWCLTVKSLLRECLGTRGVMNTIHRVYARSCFQGIDATSRFPDALYTLQKGSGLKLLIFPYSLFTPPPLLTQLS